MNELLKEFFVSILNEADRPVSIAKQSNGTVVNARGNRLRAKNMKGKIDYYENNERKEAQIWARGTEPPRQAEPETEPTPTKPKSTSASKEPERTSPISQTPRSSKPTARDVQAVRKLYPDAQQVTIVDQITADELDAISEEYGIESGEEDLSPDMADMDEKQLKRYASKSLRDYYSDDEYYSRMRKNGFVVREPLYKMEPRFVRALKSRGFPAQYIQLVERSINVKRSKENTKFSDMLAGVGAGQNRSQFGEVMSMAMIAMEPEDRYDFAVALANQVNNGGIDCIADSGWIDSSLEHATAFDTHCDELYGQGNWRLEGTAWDRREDIEGLGLPYKNKGFSTDALFRVQPMSRGKPRGAAQAVRASLKKDENVMLFNGGAGEVKGLVRRSYLSEEDFRKYNTLEKISYLLGAGRSPEERNLGLRLVRRLSGNENMSLKEARDSISNAMNTFDERAQQEAPPFIRDVLRRVVSFSDDQATSGVGLAEAMSQSNLPKPSDKQARQAIKAAAEEFKANVWDEDMLRKSYEVVYRCKDADDMRACIAQSSIDGKKIGNSNEEISKVTARAAAVASVIPGNESIATRLDNHFAIADDLNTDYMLMFSRDYPAMMASLVGVMKEKFPLAVVMGGAEMMMIDGVHINSSTLKTMFGVDDYEKLRLGLTFIRMDNGNVVLAYQAEGSSDPIIIGLADARQKGRGYAALGFEIKCSDEFVLAAAEANINNGHTSEYNDARASKIRGRLEKRRA